MAPSTHLFVYLSHLSSSVAHFVPLSIPPFFSLPLHFYLSSVCLLYRVAGGGNLAHVLGITYLTIFQTRMKHVLKKNPYFALKVRH